MNDTVDFAGSGLQFPDETGDGLDILGENRCVPSACAPGCKPGCKPSCLEGCATGTK